MLEVRNANLEDRSKKYGCLPNPFGIKTHTS